MERPFDQILNEDIDLVEYIKAQGLHIKKLGSHHLTTEEHDSLVITPAENKFYWNSRECGGMTIQFAMLLHGFDKHAAMSHLRPYLRGAPQQPAIRRAPQDAVGKEPSKPFKLPPKSQSGYRNAMAYLIKTRQLDMGVVQQMVDEKKLFQDERKNVCFAGRDYDGTVRYASVRTTNTNTTFRGECAGSRKEVGFSHNLVGQNAPRLFVAESPIDTLSLMSMIKQHGQDYNNYAYLSLGGTDTGALKYHLTRHPELAAIYLCQDNDEAGDKSRKACREWLQKQGFAGRIVDKPPLGKDYNDDLKQLNTQKQQNIERGIQHEIQRR